MHDGVRNTDCAGETVGWCRHRGIIGTNQRQVCLLSCFYQMCLNSIHRKGTGNLAGVAPTHSITDDIESKWRIRDKTILVVRPLEPDIGFRAMQSFECQTIPLLGRETLQAGAELACEFIRAPIAVRQLFL
jgi:hypothetical protein